MPNNPTKENYLFDNWYIDGDPLYPVSSSTVVYGEIIAVASWTPSIQLAILPSTLTVSYGNTNTIVVNGPAGMESYSFASSNSSIASVDSNGIVTGLSLGDATITITGTRSLTTRTVEVTVSNTPPETRTVTFYDDDGETVLGTATVTDGNSLGQSMIAQQTRQDYVFAGWYINGNALMPFTDSTVVTGGDVDVIAKWKEKISIATITTNPSPLKFLVGTTAHIAVSATGSGEVEGYEISSSDSNYVTIVNGTVYGEDVGTATITVTGTESGTTQTVNAQVVDKYDVEFYNDGVLYDTMQATPNEELGGLPTPPTKTNYVFVGWYTTSTEPYTTRIDETTVIDSNKQYYARWASNTYHAEMDGTLYTSVQAAVDAAPGSNPLTATTIRLLQSVRYTDKIDLYDDNTDKNIIFDLNGFTITNNSTYVIRTKSKIEIKNGTLTGSAGCGAVEANTSTGKIVMNSGRIIATGSRQALYNEGGTVEIGGTAYLEAKALVQSDNKRGTVQNTANGTLRISGGEIVSSASGSSSGIALSVVTGDVYITGGTFKATGADTGYGVYVSGGTLQIGSSDGDHDTSNTIIMGKTNGIYTSQNISFYDGIIMAVSPNAAINNEGKITSYESGSNKIKETDTISGTTYNTLYYTMTLTKYRIIFDTDGGQVSNSYMDYNLNQPITANDLPTPTKGVNIFDGWYTDDECTVPFETFTPTTAEAVTYYAKWRFVSTLTPVQHNINSDALTAYYNNVATWVANDANDPTNSDNNANNDHQNYLNSIQTVFTTNECSACNGPNSCSSPGNGTYCEQPKDFDTGLSDNLNVYLFENGQKGSLVTYTTSTGGHIYNMIPGKTYYWESASDNTKYGVVTATGSRRTIKSNVRNLRDLGGIPVSYTDPSTSQTVSGTIKYGKLYRGAAITGGQSSITQLTKLGITREIDLREDGDGNNGQPKMNYYDIGTKNSFTDVIITNYHINPTSTQYLTTAHLDEYRKVKSALRTVMQYVVDGDSILFHCTIGSDRTGTLAYFLEGLLGVSEENRLKDYEISYFYGLTNRTRFHDYLNGSSINPRFESMYKSYPTNQAIYNYYKYETYVPDLGDPDDPDDDEMTDDELLAAFRTAMIDRNS